MVFEDFKLDNRHQRRVAHQSCWWAREQRARLVAYPFRLSITKL